MAMRRRTRKGVDEERKGEREGDLGRMRESELHYLSFVWFSFLSRFVFLLSTLYHNHQGAPGTHVPETYLGA